MGCSHISGTIYLGYVLDAVKFRPMPPINSRIYEFQSDDWDELTGKMSKSWDKFLKKKSVQEILVKNLKALNFTTSTKSEFQIMNLNLLTKMAA